MICSWEVAWILTIVIYHSPWHCYRLNRKLHSGLFTVQAPHNSLLATRSIITTMVIIQAQALNLLVTL